MAECEEESRKRLSREATYGSLMYGKTIDKIVEFFGYPRSTVESYAKDYYEELALEAESVRGTERRPLPNAIDALEDILNNHPKVSVKTLAARLRTSEVAIVKLIDEDFRYRYYRERIGKSLTSAQKATRLKMCKKVLTSLKNGIPGRLRFFSSEKIFVIEREAVNHKARWLARNVDEVPISGGADVHVLSVVSSLGEVMPPLFFAKEERNNPTCYIRVLENVVKPWIENVAASRPYVFQQDRSEVNDGVEVQSWLEENLSSFWSKDVWPQDSPDVNPMDYYVWGAIERESNKGAPKGTGSLTRAIEKAFRGLQKDVLKQACRRFRLRLEAVIAAGGSYIQ